MIEKKDEVLKWLAFSPYAYGNVNFDEILKGFSKSHPDISKEGTWASDLQKILDELVHIGLLDVWVGDVSVVDINGNVTKTKNERRYTTTFLGQIHANELLPVANELTAEQHLVLNQALPLIPSYGKINWTQEVGNVLSQNSIKFDEAIKRFLNKNGFTKSEYIPGGGIDSTSLYDTMTENGRTLKEKGSYEKYIEYISAIKTQNARKGRLEIELLISQKETNESVKSTNQHLVDNNKFLENIFYATLALTVISTGLSVGSFIIARETNQRERRKEEREVKITKAESKEQQLLFEVCRLRHLNDSLLNLFQDTMHK